MRCTVISKKYINYIPKPLQEDFVDNKVIPFVGAGFSKNGILPQGKTIPDWNELGRKVAEYTGDYSYTNAIDTFSLFEKQFSRVKLIELLAKLLCINEIKPGDTHQSFCDVFFDTICTTNFDFLIEHALQKSSRPYSIIVSEDRLPIDIHEQTRLIKLHGDFNHPKGMVITEIDFDHYIDKNKILSTYVSNLFITRTLFLVGYSFDDPDIRSLWQIINSRLGELSRVAYVVMVDANPMEILRFECRNIKVINLKGKKEDYSNILNQFFIEIKEMINEKSSTRITVTSEKAKEELILPNINKRLCFISAPNSRISLLKEMLYPLLINNQITPITFDEVIMTGDNWMTKSETLLKEASMAIVDVSDNNANVLWELSIIKGLKKKFILIADKEQFQGLSISPNNDYHYFLYDTKNDNEDFLLTINTEIAKLSQKQLSNAETEPSRLLSKSEYDAAVVSAFRLLETTLYSNKEYLDPNCRFLTIRTSLSQILHLMYDKAPDELVNKTLNYLKIRNQVLHSGMKVNKRVAMDIVKTINELVKFIKEHE